MVKKPQSPDAPAERKVPKPPKTPAASFNKGGRPSDYHSGIPEMVKKLVGEPSFMTDEQVCIVLGIGRTTFYRWKHQHPEFRDAITRTKGEVVNAICGAMAMAAMGHSVDAVKIVSRPITKTEIRMVRGKEVKTITKTVEFVHEKFKQYYPPDAKAGEFITTNLASGEFRRGGIDIPPVVKTPEEIERINQDHAEVMRLIRANAEAGGKPLFRHGDDDEVPALPARNPLSRA